MSDPAETLELERFFPYRIARLASDVSNRLAAVYGQRAGLSPSEWRVIAHLAASARISVRDIHERADLDKAKISRAVSRLEALGLVAKTVNRADRRLVELALTRKGHRVYREIVPLARAFEESLLSALGAAERETLERAIDALSDRLNDRGR